MDSPTTVTIHGVTDERRESLGSFIRRFQASDGEPFARALGAIALSWDLERDYPCDCATCADWRLTLALAQLVFQAAAGMNREPLHQIAQTLRRRELTYPPWAASRNGWS